MTKKIKKLEKETTMYRSRWESSNKALLEMAEEVRGGSGAAGEGAVGTGRVLPRCSVRAKGGRSSLVLGVLKVCLVSPLRLP